MKYICLNALQKDRFIPAFDHYLQHRIWAAAQLF
jgi:hypothetical protein